VNPVVYDTGVLVAAERSERKVWAEHRVRLEAGIVPLVPSPVVAQVSRSPKQAELRRLLRGCEVSPFGEGDAHRAGVLLGKSHTSDVVDAAVVELAVRSGADIVSGDTRDMRRLLASAGARTGVIRL